MKSHRQTIRQEEEKNSFVGIKRRINQEFIAIKESDMTKEQKTDKFVAFLKQVIADL